MENSNLVGLPRLVIYSYLSSAELLAIVRMLSKKDLERVKTSNIIRAGKHFRFSANLSKVELHVNKKRKPLDVTHYSDIRLLVDLSQPLGPQHSSRMSSYFRSFYAN